MGVLVDLELAGNTGGHVKCWQRIAEAAAPMSDHVDLTVYFLGDRIETTPLSDSVRYVTLPPRLGTRQVNFLSQGAGHTDLAPFHRRLATLLPRHDVLHTTDVFAFGQTAARVARRNGKSLVTSIHTDLPMFTEVYTGEIVRRTFGDGPVARFILDDLNAGRRSARSMQRKVDDMIHRSDHVIVSNEADRRHAARIVGDTHVSFLRRGIDKERFHPAHRNRTRLSDRFGIPVDCPVILFVGRVDATKNAMFAARLVRALIDEGHDLRFLALGDGAERHAISDLLGPHAILPGPVTQEELGWIYPSADIFVFPSESDITGNVVLEARAAGLPSLVADHPGPAQLIAHPGEDGFILPTGSTEAWLDVLRLLLSDANFRRQLGTKAHGAIAAKWPCWSDVVEQDLLPFWRQATSRSAATRIAATATDVTAPNAIASHAA